jgi:CelD/BcsL family acetyltransferase involved in cellulose biosynthesis
MSTVRLRAPSRFDRIVELETPDADWDDLARRSGNIFATKEWLSTWWSHFGRGDPLVLPVHDADGTLLAILPLYTWSRRPLRVLRFLGHGAGDELGPICAPEQNESAILALNDLLADGGRQCDLLLCEQLVGTGWDRALEGLLLREHGNPALHCKGGWEEFLSSLSRNLRQQLRRKERRLDREHRLRFRLADDPLRLQQDLDCLFRLHAARWHGGRSAFAGPRESFHRELAVKLHARGWLRLWFLELEGSAVASWYGFRFGGRESYYQSGRDPRFDHLSVGTVLLAHSIRAALEDGVTEYRFLRGDDAYKYRFANADRGLQTVGVAYSPSGRLALGAGAVTKRLDRFPAFLRRPFGL